MVITDQVSAIFREGLLGVKARKRFNSDGRIKEVWEFIMPTWWATLSFQHLESKKIVVFWDGMMGIFCQGNNQKKCDPGARTYSFKLASSCNKLNLQLYDYHVVVIQLFTIVGCEKPWCEKLKSYDGSSLLVVGCLCWKWVRFLSSDCIFRSSLGRSKCPLEYRVPLHTSFFLAHGSSVCEKQHEATVVFLFVLAILAASTPKNWRRIRSTPFRKPVHWIWPNAWIQEWSSRILGFNGNRCFPRWEFRTWNA